MSYLVLARKSRPQQFKEVVGQEAVVRTLQNALLRNRVPHALMFSGVRGVGKTTLARLMAKALNCERRNGADPCNQCDSCKAITTGTSVDLHEVDGASNRGIQEIRELKEKIRFLPTSSRYKIFIIDEVHMLTSEAFNALLKTLEEPPEHVYFMFATTELHKVPVTILSRCQRYELKRVPQEALEKHFAGLAKQEEISVEPAALKLIVREASGSVRDGLSLLDQIFSYCGEQVRESDVVDVLGLVSQEVIGGIASALLTGNLGDALGQLDKVYSYGMDLKRFVNDLVGWFRSLVVCKVSDDPELFTEYSEDEVRRIREIAATYSLETLVGKLHILMDGCERVNYASSPRFALEMSFIRAIQVSAVVPVAELVGRLDQLLSKDFNAFCPVTGDGEKKKDITAKIHSAEYGAAREAQPRVPSGDDREGNSRVLPTRTAQPTNSSPVAPRPTVVEDAKQEQEIINDSSGIPARSALKISQKEVRQDWQAFLDYVRDRKPWMAASLDRAGAVRLDGSELVIPYDNGADCRLLQNKENLTSLTEFTLDFFQENFKIIFRSPQHDNGGSGPGDEDGPGKMRQELANDPLVRTAIEIFNGEVGDIRVGPRFRQPSVEDEQEDDDPEEMQPAE